MIFVKHNAQAIVETVKRGDSRLWTWVCRF